MIILVIRYCQGAGVNLAVAYGAFVNGTEKCAEIAHIEAAFRNTQILHRAAVNHTEQSLVIGAFLGFIPAVAHLEFQVSDSMSAAIEKALERHA